ncbi:carboxypeptidase-like regulatory domain-containing protein [Myroides sp. C15-4]|uniref:carboxypeptidase-like regulatory domain-containing protein n=1 Tax=Myroides sp. C15-4 TaxID=3400532 RepID=UPI003D2F52BA
MKQLVLALFLVLSIPYALAQREIKGKILDAKTRMPLQATVVRLIGTALSTLTDREGTFVLYPPTSGNWELEFSLANYANKRITVEILQEEQLDLGSIFLEEDWISTEKLGLILLEDQDLEEEEIPTANSARLLQATKDPFQQAAAYTWGSSFYRMRGLDNSYGSVLINGFIMNKMHHGRPQWSNWGGLNDVMRNAVFSSGPALASSTFGGLLGTQSIVTSPAQFRKGLRLGLAGTTTTYHWKPFFNYASGLTSRGWAFALSGSYRGAKESYWQGSDYTAFSLFMGIEKKITKKHSVYFSGIIAKNKRAKNSSNTLEQTELKGINYNAYWGWQGNRKRNARYQTIQEPLLLLTHVWTFNERSKLTTTLGYQWGYQAQSRLDYQDNLNPDPVHYKNLPSYYLTQIDSTYWQMSSDEFNALPEADDFKQTTLAHLQQAEESRSSFIQQGQIDWEALYKKNTSFNGQSKIILFEDRQEDQTLSANTAFQTALNDHLLLFAGVNYRNLRSMNFKKAVDLLGGSYYKDIDSYQEKTRQDSDLNHPNRTIYAGDTYGYHYLLLGQSLEAFTQFTLHLHRVDLYFGQQVNFTNYQREGLYRNPNYPTNSYGRSERIPFNTLGIKGGVTYYLTGKHLVQLDLTYNNRPPVLQYVFDNVRVTNTITPHLQAENNWNIVGSYRLRTTRLQTRLTGYLTEIRQSTQLNFYYTEGMDLTDSKGSLVSELLTPVDTRHIGIELSLAYALSSTLKITAAAGFGQSFYTNNPRLYIQATNTAKPQDLGQAKLRHYRIANGPQTALALGLSYRAPSFWFIETTLSYLTDSYVRVSPLKRSPTFISDPQKMGRPYDGITALNLAELLQQEKLPAFTLASITAGKSWRLSNRSILGFFCSIQNIFNIRYRTGGFEQSRNATYPQEMARSSGDYAVFGTKYWYSYGRNFFIQLYYNL